MRPVAIALLALATSVLAVGVAVTSAMGPHEPPEERVAAESREAPSSCACEISTRESPGTTQEVEELRAEVARLGRAVTRLARELQRERPPLSETLVSPDRLRETLEERVRLGPGGAEESRLAAELRDWVQDALPPGASLRDVVCRASVCRLEATYPDLATYQTFVETYFGADERALWPGPTFLELEPVPRNASEVDAVIYLGRHPRAFEGEDALAGPAR